MELSVEEIEKIAHLARLQLNEAHTQLYQKEISNILTMVSDIQSADTKTTQPLFNPLDATQRLRADSVSEEVQKEALLNIAPATEAGLYLVPKVIDNA